jgi:hypothetical protein
MWQIHIASGNVNEVVGESLDFITLNFNEGKDQEPYLQLKCLVTNTPITMCSLGKRPYFYQVSQLITSSSM